MLHIETVFFCLDGLYYSLLMLYQLVGCFGTAFAPPFKGGRAAPRPKAPVGRTPWTVPLHSPQAAANKHRVPLQAGAP